MTPLESRKQLLLAESELHRALLAQEWAALTDESAALTRQAATIGAMMSAAAALVAGLSSLGGKKSAPPAEKSSWVQTLLKGAGLLATLWPVFCPPPRD